jgi:hypothetical protein
LVHAIHAESTSISRFGGGKPIKETGLQRKIRIRRIVIGAVAWALCGSQDSEDKDRENHSSEGTPLCLNVESLEFAWKLWEIPF